MLSKTDEEVYHVLQEELTIPKTAKRLNKSITTIYRHINRLRKFRLISGTSYRGFNFTPSVGGWGLKTTLQYRLHFIHYKLSLSKKLRFKEPKHFDGFTICFYGTTAILTQADAFLFTSPTIEGCYEKAGAYEPLLFRHFEDRFGVTILLHEKTHGGEIAQLGGGLPEVMEEKKAKLCVKDRQDGKNRIITDFSFNRGETEATHPEKARGDAKTFMEDVIEGWLYKEAFTPREATDAIGRLATLQTKAQEKLHAEIITHLALMRQEIRDFKKNPRKKPDIQEGLGRWL